MKNALCKKVVALGASMQVATRDSSPIVGKPELIHVEPIGNGKSAYSEQSLRSPQARLSVLIRSLGDQVQGLFTSENCFHHAAVDPQRRTIGGRRKLAGQIGHHCRNFIHGGKALQ